MSEQTLDYRGMRGKDPRGEWQWIRDWLRVEEPAPAKEPAQREESDGAADQGVRTEAGAAEGSHGAKTGLPEHRDGAARGLVAEGAGKPTRDRVGLDQATTLLFDGVQSGLQSGGGYAASAELLVHHKTGDAPEFLRRFWRELSVSATFVDARELVAGAVLAPADRFAIRVDEDAMSAANSDQRFLLAPVSDAALSPGRKMPGFRHGAGTMKMHAGAKIPAISPGKELYKVGPGFGSEFFRGVGGCN